jgi:hypothetical protein
VSGWDSKILVEKGNGERFATVIVWKMGDGGEMRTEER